MPESETVEALKRAGGRAAYHLLRAGVEALKALEALVDELSRVGGDDREDEEGPRRVRIEVE